jgi:hypothetical protein
MSVGEARQVLVDANATPHIVQARPETIPDQVWLANKIYTSTIHPDTGEKIPQPFRMSGFALYGSPIVVGMLLPNPTGSIGQIVFWQWVHILRLSDTPLSFLGCASVPLGMLLSDTHAENGPAVSLRCVPCATCHVQSLTAAFVQLNSCRRITHTTRVSTTPTATPRALHRSQGWLWGILPRSERLSASLSDSGRYSTGQCCRRFVCLVYLLPELATPVTLFIILRAE